MHGAGADLALHRAAGGDEAAGVDERGEVGRVGEHAVEAQDVRDQVVGEDGQPIDVGERRDAGERQVVGGDLRPLVEARIVEERHLARQRAREALGGAAGLVDDLSAVRSPSHVPSWLSARA